MLSEGTIIALSTAAGSGAIGLIRISGERPLVSQNAFFSSYKEKTAKQKVTPFI